jgi:hypothetical protein
LSGLIRPACQKPSLITPFPSVFTLNPFPFLPNRVAKVTETFYFSTRAENNFSFFSPSPESTGNNPHFLPSNSTLLQTAQTPFAPIGSANIPLFLSSTNQTTKKNSYHT